jgi:hypothetical protein
LSVSSADRAAARRSLQLLKSPTEVTLEAKAGEIEFYAVLHMVEMLMALARPVPIALRQRLEPWTLELERRRERLLQEARRIDARPDSGART